MRRNSRPWWSSVLSRAIEDRNDPLHNILERLKKPVSDISGDGGPWFGEGNADPRGDLHVHLKFLAGGGDEHSSDLCLPFKESLVAKLGTLQYISLPRGDEVRDECDTVGSSRVQQTV